jgi:hypothetical protein
VFSLTLNFFATVLIVRSEGVEERFGSDDVEATDGHG